MKCCSAQITSCWEDPERTLKKIEPCIRQAASAGARIIAFPEQFATGWDPCSDRHIQDSSGTIVSTLKKYALEYSIAVLGSFRQAQSTLPKNTAVVVDDTGTIRAQYAKMHPFTYAGEDGCYMAGDEIGIFELDGMRLGIAICYDLRFSELFRIYANKGVHAVIVPSAWPKSRSQHWELFIKARAAENQMYVIGVNTTGTNPVDVYAGGSMTADPDGLIIARAEENETVLLSELNISMVKDARSRFPVQKDQQTELYHRLHQRD